MNWLAFLLTQSAISFWKPFVAYEHDVTIRWKAVVRANWLTSEMQLLIWVSTQLINIGNSLANSILLMDKETWGRARNTESVCCICG